MSTNRKDFVTIILEHLISIMRGELSISYESIDKEKDEDIKAVLTGIKYLNEDLELSQHKNKIAMSKLEKSNRQLKLAKDKAESASRAKDEFLSMISHEIRTPLNAVTGMTNLLIQENPRDDQLEHLKSLKFSSENLLSIINDILDFSKIEAGKIEFEKRSFDIIELIKELFKSLKPNAEEKGLQLKLTIQQNLPKNVIGDPTRLSQVIFNLLNNALKFTSKGSVVLYISAKDISESNVTFIISIKDTGIGISKDKLKKIFKSFSQANSSITRKFGGTGLGLTITKKLIELQKGSIEVQSKYNQGSEFKFYLPYMLQTKNKTLAEIPHLAIDTFKFFPNVKVLLVEDIKLNQIILTKFLEKWKMAVDIAANGKIALEKINNSHYDLILMDLQMPIMDGYTATRRIRKIENGKYENIPILAVTASTLSDIQKKVFKVGMNDFIAKPVNPKELNDKLAKHLNYN